MSMIEIVCRTYLNIHVKCGKHSEIMWEIPRKSTDYFEDTRMILGKLNKYSMSICFLKE